MSPYTHERSSAPVYFNNHINNNINTNIGNKSYLLENQKIFVTGMNKGNN